MTYDSCVRGVARLFQAHCNQEVRFSSSVKCRKGPQVLTSLLDQRRNYYYMFQVTKKDVENILAWEKNQSVAGGVEVSFKPARVILQDFTGVPAVVDFAAMRDAVKRLGGDPQKINPICPSDLVIDHSVQVDFSGGYVAHIHSFIEMF